MIKHHAKARIQDLTGHTQGLELEVNWEPDNQDTNEAKVIRVTFPDGRVGMIKREEFLSFLFIISKQEDQMKILPQTITKTKWYETVLGIVATKDIAKGEKINVPIKLSLPDERREAIAELKREMGSNIIY